MRCPNHKVVGGTLRRKTKKKPLDRVAEKSKKNLSDIRQNALIVSKNKKKIRLFFLLFNKHEEMFFEQIKDNVSPKKKKKLTYINGQN